MTGVDLIIERCLAHTDRLRAEHAAAGRPIEAAACEIRAQALREALAIVRGRALPALTMRQSRGVRSAEADTSK